jgi:predicted enzyme related to lactoylglutathione lyase
MSLFLNVNVVSLNVLEWEKSKQFYREVLGWPVCYSDEGLGWEEYGLDGATHLALQRWDDPAALPPRIGGTTVVLGVEDVTAVISALRAKGVRCTDPVIIPGVVAYANFFDPEGNKLQIAGMPPAL